MKPGVSIIVPVYNVSHFIERCSSSLFEQTFENIEYIFVNDCTPDNSIQNLEEIVKQYPNRRDAVTIIHHDKNRGLAAARNTGLKVAQGDYILHIDSDDYIELDMVDLMYNSATENKADIVICDFVREWGKVKKISRQSFSNKSVEYTMMLLSDVTATCVWNKLIKASLYKKNNIIFVEGIGMGEDYAVTPRLAYFASKISKVEEPLYHYIQFNQNAITKSFSQSSVESLISALVLINDFFVDKPDVDNYTTSLLQGRLRKKVAMLMSTDAKQRQKVACLFPEANSVLSVTEMPLQERIAIYLSNNKLYRCLTVFLYIFNNSLEIIQILKKRR